VPIIIEQNPLGVATNALESDVRSANEERRTEGAYQQHLAMAKQRATEEAARFGWEKAAEERQNALRGVAGEAASFESGLSRPSDVPEDPQRRYAMEIQQRGDIAKRMAELSPEHAHRFLEETQKELEDRMTSEGLDALKGQILQRTELDSSIPGLGEGPLDARAQYQELAGMLDAAKNLPPAQRAQALGQVESHYRDLLQTRAESQKRISATLGRAQAWQAIAGQRRASGDHATADAIDAITAQMANDPTGDPSKYDLPLAAAQAGPKAAAELQQTQTENANLKAQLGQILAHIEAMKAETARTQEQTRASQFEHSVGGKIATGIARRIGQKPSANGAASKPPTALQNTSTEKNVVEIVNAKIGPRDEKNAAEWDKAAAREREKAGSAKMPSQSEIDSFKADVAKNKWDRATIRAEMLKRGWDPDAPR